MKKFLIISLFLLTANLAKADQLAWLTKDEAEMTVQFFNKYGINRAVFWCACCDGDTPIKIEITKVFYKYTGTEEYYEVVIQGTDENGNYVNDAVDLAYVHIPSGTKANCLGQQLGFECDPCTAPFSWPK
jgi:hypothetical protein